MVIKSTNGGEVNETRKTKKNALDAYVYSNGINICTE